MKLPASVKIKENSFLASLAARKLKASRVAMVIGSTIHLHNTTAQEFLRDKHWVKHELKHVEQFRQYGFLPFLSRYLVEWIKNGYFNNRFEKEAREAETSLE